MKTFTITALVGALITIPLLLGKRRPQVVPITVKEQPEQLDSNLRYDVDDFLTE